MSSRLRPCCVPGCNNREAKRHSITRKDKCQEIWLQRINNAKLLTLSDESLKSYRICDAHFEDTCKEASDYERVENDCFLPRSPDEEKIVTPKKVKEALEALKSPVSGSSPIRPIIPPEKVYGRKRPFTRSTAGVDIEVGTENVTEHTIEDVSFDVPSTSGYQKTAADKPLLEPSTPGYQKISSPIRPLIRPEKVYGRKRLFSTITDVGTEVGTGNVTEQTEDKAISSKVPSTSGHQKTFTDKPVLEPSTSGYKKIPSAIVGVKFGVAKRRGLRARVPQTKRPRGIPPTSTERKLIQQLNKFKWVAKKARKNNVETKQKLKFLQKNPLQVNFLKDINPTTIRIFDSQLKNQKLEPKGRRFTLDDKIFALAIFKQSGKSYRFLSKIFSLPSRKTLNKILSKIPFSCGFNEHVFSHLKNKVAKMNPLDKCCVLMFDEVSLSTGLMYNSSRDCVEGLVDFGQGDRRVAFAEHALVFMLKGVRKGWKQPICFYFCESTTPTPDLIRIIKDVVRHVRNTGLEIIATICDQGATNSAAIKQLLNETKVYCLKKNIENRYQGYLIDEKEVIHLYDYPHLLKGIRNGLLTKDLHFKHNGCDKVACWSHVVDMYNMDRKMGKFTQFSKLTDEHVLPNRIKKMKVKNCTQVFSKTMSAAMKIRAEISKELPSNSSYYLPPSASDTADLLLFFDEVFDSVNGNLLHPPLGKELRGVVSEKSKHVNVWQESLPVIKSMYFTTSSSRTVTPSITNWEFTLRGFIYIWKLLKSKGFKYMSPRNFNQDPLENFFGLIRSHGVRNTNPSCTAFISSTKTLLINNFLSSHSAGSNCEEDESDGVLDTLREFINLERTESATHDASPNISNAAKYYLPFEY
ncbi:hypothetical protein NQ315_016241 [Exocentrus adspersus]|uniref:THAP-type domain-containing protein n=1 Tax=Exocentrus adspersus TaxID=1586481 RepID=A0AAV8VIK7_9CUCU|nr:hypothetical protein NQ315_016241 [Exocentrus adspersus]